MRELRIILLLLGATVLILIAPQTLLCKALAGLALAIAIFIIIIEFKQQNK